MGLFFRIFEWIVNLFIRFFVFLLNLTYKKAGSIIAKKARVDAHAAVLARARLKRESRVLIIMFHILVILFTSALAIGVFIIDLEDYNLNKIIIIPVLVFVAILFIISLFKNIKIDNISVMETSDVINCSDHYALYLRAFESDQRRRVFKEEDFVQALLDQQVVTFAVGLPEEIDASPGAQRVYINNDTWQEEVRLMMNHAKCLFLRICDTEPCLWEVKQALSLNKELYIIIDNADEYAIVSNKCDGLPQNISIKQGMYVIYKRLPDGSWEKQSLDEVDEDSSYDDAYKESYTEGLLERFPMPSDAEIYEYENSIEGLFSNLINGWEIQYVDPVAERIMELIDIYCSNFGETDDENVDVLEVSENIQNYLDKLRRIHPLSDQLMKRREELFDKVGYTGRRYPYGFTL